MKNHFLKIKMLSTCMLLALTMQAQTAQQSAKEQFEQKFIPPANPDWITAREESNIAPQDFYSQFGEAIGLTANDEMRFVRENNDEPGMLHQRFQQYHKGYKVYGGEFILHSQGNRLLTANGKLMRNYEGTLSINLSEEKALENAEVTFPTQKFLWKNEKMEQMIRENKKDPAATYFPRGELVWMW